MLESLAWRQPDPEADREDFTRKTWRNSGGFMMEKHGFMIYDGEN
jgi:hypothetical protein